VDSHKAVMGTDGKDNGAAPCPAHCVFSGGHAEGMRHKGGSTSSKQHDGMILIVIVIFGKRVVDKEIYY
jgi:hypothetical protein